MTNPYHLRMPCPHCGRELRIRNEYLGLNIGCKHCHHTFRARQEDLLDPLPRAAPPVPAADPHGEGQAAGRIQELQRELQHVCSQLTEQVSRHTATLQELQAVEDRFAQAEVRAVELQEHLEILLERHLRAAAATSESAATRSERDALRAEVERLRNLVTDVRLDASSPELLAGSREADQEKEALRAQLEAQAADASRRLDHLARQRDDLADERDRLGAEVQALRFELSARATEADRLGAERDALAHEAEQLRARRVELEQASARSEADLAEIRDRAEADRRELQEGRDAQRRDLLEEAERRLEDERARHEAERQAWRELSATLPSPDDPEPLRREVEVLRVQCEEAGRHVESLARERDRLQSRLDDVERERLAGPTEQVRQEAAEASRLGDELAGRVRALDAELTRLRSDHDAEMLARQRVLEGLQNDWDVERREWRERLEAALAQADRERQALQDDVERLGREAQAARLQRDDALRRSETSSLEGSGLAADPDGPARPESDSYPDPEAFRVALLHWLAWAAHALQELIARTGRLESEMHEARNELDLLNRDLALGEWGLDEEEIALPSEDS
ncbi:MAG: hypothetical protein JO252_24095 [Planctomycetaceae bacterium]|nr:hypothetical protein [Planctomycetaceae bacterium]